MNENKITSNKKVHLEVMRIFATFFVIYNHTGLNGFLHHLTLEMTTMKYWVYLFLSIFCKFSVPLFLMISGALLIKKEETMGRIFKIRISKIIIALIGISFLHYIYQLKGGRDKFNLLYFLRVILTGQWSAHLWYLYMFIAYLICLPILRVLANNMEKKHFEYIIWMSLAIKFLSVIEFFLWQGRYEFNGYLKCEWFVSDILLFPLVGYFWENIVEIDKINKKHILMMWIINMVSIILICYATYYKAIVTGDISEQAAQTFHNIIPIINASVIYITVKYFCHKVICAEWIKRGIISLGKCTYGIYLFHLLIEGNQYIAMEWMKINNFLHVYFKINHLMEMILYCTFVMIISYFMISIIKRLPIIGKLI